MTTSTKCFSFCLLFSHSLEKGPLRLDAKIMSSHRRAAVWNTDRLLPNNSLTTSRLSAARPSLSLACKVPQQSRALRTVSPPHVSELYINAYVLPDPFLLLYGSRILHVATFSTCFYISIFVLHVYFSRRKTAQVHIFF